MNARYYVSSIGRFASADVLIPDPGISQAYNRYAYVENRPIRFTDPSGHYAICFQGGPKSTEYDPSFVEGVCRDLDDKGLLGGFDHLPNTRSDISKAIRFIKNILEENPNEPITILGYSWGGGAALELVYLLQKENIEIANLVLIDPIVHGRIELGRAPIDVRENGKLSLGNFYILNQSVPYLKIIDYDLIVPDNVSRSLNIYSKIDLSSPSEEGIENVFNAVNVSINGDHFSMRNTLQEKPASGIIPSFLNPQPHSHRTTIYL